MPPRPFVPRRAGSRIRSTNNNSNNKTEPTPAAPPATSPAEQKKDEEDVPPENDPPEKEEEKEEVTSSPLSQEEAEQLTKLLRKLVRVGLPQSPPVAASSQEKHEPEMKSDETEEPMRVAVDEKKVDGGDDEKSKRQKLISAAPAAACSVIRTLAAAGLVKLEEHEKLFSLESSSGSSSSSDSCADSSSAEGEGEAMSAAKTGGGGPRSARGNKKPSPPTGKDSSTRPHHHNQNHHHNQQQQQHRDKPTIKNLFSSTRATAHVRGQSAIADSARSTMATVSTILDALGGVMQARFVSLLVPDEMRPRELRCVAFGGLESATRTQDSFSSYSRESERMLINAASLAMHHNTCINVRLPGSGAESDGDDEPAAAPNTAAAAAGGIGSARRARAAVTKQHQQPTPGGAAKPVKDYFSAVQCSASFPVVGTDFYPVATLHVCDRSYGVTNFSEEDEAIIWNYCQLLSRIIGAHEKKRNSMPDAAVQRALRACLSSVEAVDGVKIRQILEGDFIPRRGSSEASGGAVWDLDQETVRAPPVYRTQSARVKRLLQKLIDNDILFTTRASAALGDGKIVDCSYHLPLEGTQQAAELLPLCVISDHTHRISDAWFRTATLLAESRTEVTSLKSDIKRLTASLAAAHTKSDIQRALLIAGPAAGNTRAASTTAGGSYYSAAAQPPPPPAPPAVPYGERDKKDILASVEQEKERRKNLVQNLNDGNSDQILKTLTLRRPSSPSASPPIASQSSFRSRPSSTTTPMSTTAVGARPSVLVLDE